MRYFITIIAIFVLPSCELGYRAQPYDLPSLAIEKAVKEADETSDFDESAYLPEEWWTVFNDSQLTEFIETALANNPTIHAAYTRTMLAVYNAQRIRSALFPNLFWGADVSRQKFSETGIIPFTLQDSPGNTPLAAAGGINGIPVYFTQWETEFNFSLDFDLWGKNRNSWLSALNEIQAKIADEAFARLKLSVDIAKIYFRLQIGYKRLKIAQEYVHNTETIVDYYQRRIQANLDNGLNLYAAEVNLSLANQSLLKIQAEISVDEYQMKTYLARNFDEEICDIQIDERPLPTVPLPLDLPLHLISRRPDIVAQLWLIESAGKQIAVAKAGFYPDFNLIALFGFQTIHLHELFRYPSAFFNVDPAVSLPIFDGGRLNANLRGSEVNYDLAIYKYNELVLNAAKEVLEGIAVFRNALLQQNEYSKTVQYQNNLLQINEQRVSGNLNSSISSLTSQANVYHSQDQEIAALGYSIQSMLNLIKALGGGYDQR